MADTYLKVLGKVLVADGEGNAITSTVVGAKRSLDVNVTGGDIIIDNPTIIVDIDGFGATPDSVLIVGSENATTTGIRHVARMDSNGQLETLNMNTAGAGAVNIQDGGNSITVDATNLDIRDLVFATDKADISGSTLGANSGIDIGDVTVNNAAGVAAVNIQDGGNSITVDGAVSAVQSGNWDIRNVTGTVSLPTGAATAALQTQPGVDIGDVTVNNASGASAVNIQDGGNSITVDGTVSLAAGSAVIGHVIADSGSTTVVTGNVTVVQPTGTNLHAVIDSGTVAATQSGTWNINNISGTVSLPTGASTAALQTQPGVDIGDVTVNNAPGAAAVNIQDGGNSITVDGTIAVSNFPATQAVTQSTSPWVVSGTVAATQSGTWNITNVSGTVSLPTGAATLAEQQTQTASLSVLDDWDETDRAKVNIIAGQVGVQAGAGNSTANTQRVVIATDQVAIATTDATPQDNTYNAATTFTIAANATDVFTIVGSATKTVKIREIALNGTNTGNTNALVLFVKRSTANSGGTSSTITAVPVDSTNAAATAVIRSYTANPTLGSLVGNVRADIVFFPVLASTNAGTDIAQEFGTQGDMQPLVLRGTSEVLAINFNGTAIAGTTVVAVDIRWTEE